jgi:hypothetical protein
MINIKIFNIINIDNKQFSFNFKFKFLFKKYILKGIMCFIKI